LRFKDFIEINPVIITEGSVIERLKREYNCDLDKNLLHSTFIYDERKLLLKNIYRQYLDIACKYSLPILIFTPTWRANYERIQLSLFNNERINEDCFRFLLSIKEEYQDFKSNIFIGGLIGCKGDSYKPQEALPVEKSYLFHKYQIEALTNSGVDFLFASTLPAFSEALGIAKAMSESGKDYVISFIIRPCGKILDGTQLFDAISQIDSEVENKPLFYTVNCVHPYSLKEALTNCLAPVALRKRLKGIQGNTSRKSPEELDGLKYLDSQSPAAFADSLIDLHFNDEIKILGGCCGTNNEHIGELSRRLSKNK